MFKVLSAKLISGDNSRLAKWSKLFGITIFFQALIQILGFVSGIVVIRTMSTSEYALYTIANTMLGAMTLLSDSGISTGVMAEGGKVWNNKEKLGSIFTTAFNLRRKFALYSLIVVAPILFILLTRHGATWWVSLAIILAIIPAFFAAMFDSLLEVVLKLNQNILGLQKNQLLVSVARFLMTIATLLFFPFTVVAILANGIPRIWGNIKLRRMADSFLGGDRSINEEARRNILNIVKRTLPGALYYCLSGQITIWIISVMGSTDSVGELGALGRLGILVGFVLTMGGIVIVPRFARLPAEKNILFRRFAQIQAGIVCISLFIVLLTYLFSREILLVLGPQYSNLNYELLLMVIASGLNLISGMALSLLNSRGYVVRPVISIGISILALVVGAWLINVSTLSGVLVLNIFLSIVHLSIFNVYGFAFFLRMKKG